MKADAPPWGQRAERFVADEFVPGEAIVEFNDIDPVGTDTGDADPAHSGTPMAFSAGFGSREAANGVGSCFAYAKMQWRWA